MHITGKLIMVAAATTVTAATALAQWSDAWPSEQHPFRGQDHANETISALVERVTCLPRQADNYLPSLAFTNTHWWGNFFRHRDALVEFKYICENMIHGNRGQVPMYWLKPEACSDEAIIDILNATNGTFLNDYTWSNKVEFCQAYNMPTNWFDYTPWFRLYDHSNGYRFVQTVISNMTWYRLDGLFDQSPHNAVVTESSDGNGSICGTNSYLTTLIDSLTNWVVEFDTHADFYAGQYNGVSIAAGSWCVLESKAYMATDSNSLSIRCEASGTPDVRHYLFAQDPYLDEYYDVHEYLCPYGYEQDSYNLISGQVYVVEGTQLWWSIVVGGTNWAAPHSSPVNDGSSYAGWEIEDSYSSYKGPQSVLVGTNWKYR